MRENHGMTRGPLDPSILTDAPVGTDEVICGERDSLSVHPGALGSIVTHLCASKSPVAAIGGLSAQDVAAALRDDAGLRAWMTTQGGPEPDEVPIRRLDIATLDADDITFLLDPSHAPGLCLIELAPGTLDYTCAGPALTGLMADVAKGRRVLPDGVAILLVLPAAQDPRHAVRGFCGRDGDRADAIPCLRVDAGPI